MKGFSASPNYGVTMRIIMWQATDYANQNANLL